MGWWPQWLLSGLAAGCRGCQPTSLRVFTNCMGDDPSGGAARMSGGQRRVNQVLLYVNQVYPDDYTGQGTFERELLAALRQRVQLEPAMLLRVFTVHRPGDTRRELSP